MTDRSSPRTGKFSFVNCTCIAIGYRVGDIRQTDLFSIHYKIGHSSDIPFIVFIWVLDRITGKQRSIPTLSA